MPAADTGSNGELLHSSTGDDARRSMRCGQARAVAKLAREHHWPQIIVVSGIPQTTRARIRLDRCYHGTPLFVPASPGDVGDWIYNVFYEWSALAKAMSMQRGC